MAEFTSGQAIILCPLFPIFFKLLATINKFCEQNKKNLQVHGDIEVRISLSSKTDMTDSEDTKLIEYFFSNRYINIFATFI